MDSSTSFSWGGIFDLAFDEDGNLLILGEGRADNEAVPLWSLQPDGSLRWALRGALDFGGPPGGDGRPFFAGVRDGVVYIRATDRHALLKLDTSNGRGLGRLGEREPEGAREARLDLCKFDDLTLDADGSWLGLCRGRLVRWQHDGSASRVWPRPALFWKLAGLGLIGREKSRPLYAQETGDDGFDDGASSCRSRELTPGANFFDSWIAPGARPKFLPGAQVRAGQDGKLYALYEAHGYPVLARYDRSGDLDYRCALPVKAVGYRGLRGADAGGRAYLLIKDDQDREGLARVAADGRSVTELFFDSELREVAVARDGTLAATDSATQVRLLTADGDRMIRDRNAGKPTFERVDRTVARKPVRLPLAGKMRFALLTVLILFGLGRIYYFEASVRPRVEQVIATGQSQQIAVGSRFSFELTPERARPMNAVLAAELIREGITIALLGWCFVLSLRFPRDSLFVAACVLVSSLLIGAAANALRIQAFADLYLNFNLNLFSYVVSLAVLYVWGLALIALPKRIKWAVVG